MHRLPTITGVNVQMDREPLLHPFGFKGGQLTELWQPIVKLQGDRGYRGTGVGVQSPLWSDTRLMATLGEQDANRLMMEWTQEAASRLEGVTFEHPVDLFGQLRSLRADTWFADKGFESVRPTFVLNALAAIDFAAWVLYAREKGTSRFVDLLPESCTSILKPDAPAVMTVPVVAYGTSDEEITELLMDGYSVLKIKLGSAPEGSSGSEDMLNWDMQRFRHIHKLVTSLEDRAHMPEPIRYYLDLNGRYEAKDDLLRLLEDSERSGSLPKVVLVEEPFLSGGEITVDDVPACIAADESIQSEEDARHYMDLGYGAIALKPAAKSMSLSIQVAALASERGVPCFCADLTASPLLVEWTRVLAAHLQPLPGMSHSLMESNGRQNYSGWDRLESYHPAAGAVWTIPDSGRFLLDEAFYKRSGGVFELSGYYEKR
ncbi:enolase C-terminal domain-like protein [Paenibacillus sp. FJAT-26967]|uniref:enolase C-terminal domain-like protein n=1 Tax=Paenibacillus sp. FJAT-26967 TaxID=1729690 RepID=UPI0020A44C85|nr:enolase C-terminal domain-like protein [Paenibacillus sp. FJAT-26967]